MPIKFRCQHCRQFLGISRSKAGEAVDCPTCGRAIRVPHLDGRIEPLPQPALNLRDANLARALDELAMIGHGPLDDDGPPPPPLAPLRQATSLPPAPSPEVIEVEPPLPAVPVSGPSAAAKPPAAGPSASAVAELTALRRGEEARPAEAAGPPERSSRAWTTLFPLPVLLALCGAVAVSFGLGYAAGRGGGSDADRSAADGPARPAAADAAPAGGAAGARSPALRGRITYRTDSGESRPDRGARVIVLPLERAGEVRLPVVGFRAGDGAADLQVALSGLRTLGGEMAVVDDDGNFQIGLPRAGTYHVLVLSRFQSRDPGDSIESALRSVLEAWFDRPDQLLGRLGYHFGQSRYKGEGTELWDHTFDRSPGG